jgi:hypothetical protein
MPIKQFCVIALYLNRPSFDMVHDCYPRRRYGKDGNLLQRLL